MPNRIIGYARTSTADQVAGLEAQVRDLLAAGCEQPIFAEHISSVSNERAELKRALVAVDRGDTLVVTKPDRLARSTIELLTMVRDLDVRGVGLILLSMGGDRIDSRSPTGKVMLTMLAAMAEFERSLMLERQAIGILKAKADGKYKGRKPTAPSLVDSVAKMHRDGLDQGRIAANAKVSVRSVGRIIKAVKAMELGHIPQSPVAFADAFPDQLDVAA